LVDVETAVDLRLLESPEAAAAATRDGLRRLFLLELRTTLAKLEAQLPGVIAQGPLVVAGAPVPPPRQIVLRALDAASRLPAPAGVPRGKAAFPARVAEGRAALPGALAQLGRTAVELGIDLMKVRAGLKPLGGTRGTPRAAHDDIQSQLAHLVPPDL